MSRPGLDVTKGTYIVIYLMRCIEMIKLIKSKNSLNIEYTHGDTFKLQLVEETAIDASRRVRFQISKTGNDNTIVINKQFSPTDNRFDITLTSNEAAMLQNGQMYEYRITYFETNSTIITTYSGTLNVVWGTSSTNPYVPDIPAIVIRSGTVEEKLKDISDKCARNSDDIAANASDIAKNATAIVANTKSIEQNAAAIDQIKSNVENNSVSIEQNSVCITKNSQSIADIEGRSIVCSASGNTISLKDSSNSNFRGLRIFGKTTQGENPTPESPQEFSSVGDSGSVDINIKGENLHSNNQGTRTQTVNGCTYTLVDGKTELVVTGMSTSAFSIPLSKLTLAAGTYSISFWGATYGSMYIYVTNASNGKTILGGIYSKNTLTITETTGVMINMVILAEKSFDNNSIKVHLEKESYSEQQVFSVSTPTALFGVSVESGGNYTDANGQQYIADFVDCDKGVHVHWTEIINSYNGEEITTPYISTTGELSIGATVIYALLEPYETDLTDEEITAYKALHTNKPGTYIYNNDDAFVEIEYAADTKAYVDNQIAAKVQELMAAIITE